MLCTYFTIPHMNSTSVDQSMFILIAHALIVHKAHPVHFSKVQNKVVK